MFDFDEIFLRLEGEFFFDLIVMVVLYVFDVVDVLVEVGYIYLQERQEKVFKYIKRFYYI